MCENLLRYRVLRYLINFEIALTLLISDTYIPAHRLAKRSEHSVRDFSRDMNSLTVFSCTAVRGVEGKSIVSKNVSIPSFAEVSHGACC